MRANNPLSFLVNRLPSAFQDQGMQALIVTNVLGNVIRLLSNLLLARWLSPEAFAITGLSATVIFAFNMISDGGFRAFILRHQKGDEISLLKTLWTIRLLRNVVLACLMFVFSDAIARYFAIDDLSLVLKVLCICFIVEGFLPIGFIAIERQNRIARIMYVRFASTLLSTLFMIVGVFYVQTYWPIVFSMIANQIFQMLLGYFFIGYKGTGFFIRKDVALELFGWAKYVIPSSIITLILVQIDKVIFGKTLSISELGLYFIAFNFSAAAATFTIEYARGVLQPYLSTVYRESPDRYMAMLYSKKQRMSLLIALFLGVLSGGSYLFFEVLYEERYLAAGFYLSLLLITPVMTLVTYPAEVTLILHGYIKTTLIANIIRLVWFAVGSVCSYLWWGTLGLLITIVLVELFPAIYMMYRLVYFQAVSVMKEISILIVAVIGFLVTRYILFLIG